MRIPLWPPPPTTELGWLTQELRQSISPCPFRFEWSNARQGLKLLLSSDWGRRRTHTTRTIRGVDTRHSSRLLKLVHRDLAATGFTCVPSWTDLRHLWSIRAQADGMARRTAALAQAHSERMAAAVYLRHGERRQTLAGIGRFDSIFISA